MSLITKLKSTFRTSKSKQHSTDTVASIINDVDNEPFAISDANVLFAGLNELGGYYFFQTVVVGTLNIKTLKGAQLEIIGHNYKLNLDSDMLELESDRTNKVNRYVTKIDFQIEEEGAAKIDPLTLKQLVLNCKNQSISFSMYETNDEEE